MNRQPTNHGHDELSRAVRARQKRREQWQAHGERSVWRNLSMIGALGWLIVTPTLLGVLLGRWLDERLGTGIMFSAALIVLGIALGSWFAWQRMNKP